MKRIAVLPLAIVLCVTVAAAQTKPVQSKDKAQPRNTAVQQQTSSAGSTGKSASPPIQVAKHYGVPVSSSDTTHSTATGVKATSSMTEMRTAVKEPASATKQAPHGMA